MMQKIWLLFVCRSCVDIMATSTVASTSRLDIEKFNGMGYELWKIKMEDLLEERN